MGLGQGDRGYAMAALLVGLSIMAVLMSAAMPVWTHFAKREKEEELIWRGQQYARAIGLFQRKYANTFPPSVDILVEQKFLRKKYKDPITNEEFQLIPATGAAAPMPGGGQRPPQQQGAFGRPPATATPSAQQPAPTPRPGARAGEGGGRLLTGGGFQPAGGIQGVVSKSTDDSIKVFNGRTKYNEWMFVYLATSQGIGPGGGAQQPRQPSPFGPAPGTDRRPGVGPQQPPRGPGSTPPPSPFGPTRPSPFGQPPGSPPTRPPGG